MPEIQCVRCGRAGSAVPAPPFRSELGTRIQEEICEACWGEWLQRQTQLINHYALDVRQLQAREFLLTSLREFLFGERSEELGAQ